MGLYSTRRTLSTQTLAVEDHRCWPAALVEAEDSRPVKAVLGARGGRPSRANAMLLLLLLLVGVGLCVCERGSGKWVNESCRNSKVGRLIGRPRGKATDEGQGAPRPLCALVPTPANCTAAIAKGGGGGGRREGGRRRPLEEEGRTWKTMEFAAR